MVKIDAVVAAAAAYAAVQWDADDWQEFGRRTGCSDILTSDRRLLKAFIYDGPDAHESALRVLPKVLGEGVEGLTAQLQLLADAMPNLVEWTQASAPFRTQRLFKQFLQELPAAAVPVGWQSGTPGVPLDATIRLSATEARRVPNGAQVTRPEPWRPAPIGVIAEVAVSMAEEKERASEMILSNGSIVDVARTSSPNIFIVHGHDHSVVHEVQVFVNRVTGTMPEMLADLPGAGDTIIEKFERMANAASYAIVLLTPDDEGRIKGSEATLNDRARQNVVLELGYFFGKLGRNRVAVLDAGVEQPSDVHGLSYISYPGVDWKEQLRGELEHAGLARKS